MARFPLKRGAPRTSPHDGCRAGRWLRRSTEHWRCAATAHCNAAMIRTALRELLRPAQPGACTDTDADGSEPGRGVARVDLRPREHRQPPALANRASASARHLEIHLEEAGQMTSFPLDRCRHRLRGGDIGVNFRHAEESVRARSRRARGAQCRRRRESGTGLSSRRAARLATQIIGVEPSRDMCQIAEPQSAPGVGYVQGWSHGAGVDSGATDTALAVQALHWMELEATFGKVARLLAREPGRARRLELSHEVSRCPRSRRERAGRCSIRCCKTSR